MPRSREAQDRHNATRRRCTARARQAVFCMDYIQTTYTAIYNEATEFFAVLNTRNPDKVDLTKTEDYKRFKKIANGEENSSGEQLHFDVKTGLPTLKQPESQQAPGSKPFQAVQTSNYQHKSPEVPEPSLIETVQTTESPSTNQSCYGTVNKEVEPQIQIPLMTEHQVNKAMVSSQTLDITTEQEMLLPSIGEIPDKIIDEIIAQLRDDPDLSNMFQDMEFDSLGENLPDLPETTGFEKEPWW